MIPHREWDVLRRREASKREPGWFSHGAATCDSRLFALPPSRSNHNFSNGKCMRCGRKRSET